MTPEASAEERYRALLEVSEAIASHRDLAALMHDLAGRLHRLVHFDYLNLLLYDPVRRRMRLHVLESSEPTDLPPGQEFSVEESPSGWVVENQRPLIVANIDHEKRFPKVTALLRENRVKSFCALPLTTAQRRLGALGLGSVQQHAYQDEELQFLRQVASQVAVAVDNALNYQKTQDYQRELARERDRLAMVLDVTNALVTNLELPELFGLIVPALRRVIQHEYTTLSLIEPDGLHFRLCALDFPDGHLPGVREQMRVPIEDSPAGRAFTTRTPLLVSRDDLKDSPGEVTRALAAQGVKSGMCVPLVSRNRALGTINVASLREHAFGQEDLDLLMQIANQIAIAVENALAYQQIAELKDKLAKEKLYLEDEIRTEYNFEEIIGESAVLKRVLREAETVAPTGSTVLVLGESGTGKELIARAIHNLSARRDRTFVKVNCAAIPTGLLESELFGHERGAFTGAISQRIGRFELADGGTLFLDEVGDIPLELQPKLLRVLQEHEFERLGGNRTIAVDARLVAATNRDLSRMVADRQFREDLYYRLNVFPIHVPPLRERREDIPLLVRYFVQKHAPRVKKHIETIPSEALEALSRYHWPGNVRELENFIERAVILSKEPVLQIAATELNSAAAHASGEPETLEAVEREHIVRALKQSNWVIGGPHGAAVSLGMKRTTLQSRMQKLGIERHSG